MPPPPLKRSRSDLPPEEDAPRRNRVHRRVIMRGVGKDLHQASRLQAMLTGLIGGLKGHESLFNAGILHRDISIGNVMLKKAEDDGFLIDLDLAIKTDRDKASGAPNRTGTKVLMAIGALYGEDPGCPPSRPVPS
ncbi:Aminoglycoside phosphotransferase [Macrophomina phaseolina MS6]|uniref:non-specific serine/threonine protein kinase n=1 Tax=Macrophomina phaseolina (strain MS6) TaxID=1126212 RepID=K2R822_MACPH|nr:Aminoglycoside phosphotransferase [Macrophomina phaseolina MS6]